MDVNEELKFLLKFKKKKLGVGGVRVGVGVRADVNNFVKIQKKNEGGGGRMGRGSR